MKTLTNINYRIEVKDGVKYALVPVEDLALFEKKVSIKNLPLPSEVVKYNVLEGFTMLKAWRLHLGLSQQEIAERANISQSAYCQIENSKRPRNKTLKMLAPAFGLDDWRYLYNY